MIWTEMVGMGFSVGFRQLLHSLFSQESGFSPERRDFIRTTAAGSIATLGLASCGSFDRWVVGDSEHLTQEVMVIGGGLAGLTAAYHLKKSRVPFRVFEASSRLGGRVQSLTHFNLSQQVAELGGEFFDSTHSGVLQLCKDLNVSTKEVTYRKDQDRGLYWFGGKIQSEQEFRTVLRPLALKLSELRRGLFLDLEATPVENKIRDLPNAVELDGKSVADVLDSVKAEVPSSVLSCFESLCSSEWGVSTKEINLLQFLIRLDFEEQVVVSGQQSLYRVDGGNSRLVNTLGERIQGVVPHKILKMNHQLVAIREKDDGYECTFKTPTGSVVFWARKVICSIPWSLLKTVDGIQSLKLGEFFGGLIADVRYASQSKVVSGFKVPFWQKKEKGMPSYQGVLRGDLLGQVYWDSSRGQPGTQGLLTSQRGGTFGLNTGASAAEETLTDLKKFFRNPPAPDLVEVSNWNLKPYSRGSRYSVGPGGYLKYLDFLAADSDNQNFYFAGEHMSFRDFGTMNGAIVSGQVAAGKIMRV